MQARYKWKVSTKLSAFQHPHVQGWNTDQVRNYLPGMQQSRRSRQISWSMRCHKGLLVIRGFAKFCWTVEIAHFLATLSWICHEYRKRNLMDWHPERLTGRHRSLHIDTSMYRSRGWSNDTLAMSRPTSSPRVRWMEQYQSLPKKQAYVDSGNSYPTRWFRSRGLGFLLRLLAAVWNSALLHRAKLGDRWRIACKLHVRMLVNAWAFGRVLISSYGIISI